MNNRIYPKELLKNAIIDLQLDELRKEINELKAQSGSISVQIAEKEIEFEEICPHTLTKKVNASIEGGYLNRGKYITIIKCKRCNKEIGRKETDSGYA